MNLKISSDLSLPLEVVTQKLGWLGVTGSGKTYGASKLAEMLWNAEAQFVVLDPVGTWYGLRISKKADSAGIPIPVFGGLHGDIPLEATGGFLLADLIVDRGISAILDVSQFDSDAQKARFVSDFAERFFFRKKASPSAVHIFLEECQEFVPQNPQRGEEQMLHRFHRLQKLGRNFGIGTSLISQRPQEVNKKALNQAQTLFVFRLTGSQERKAVELWIEDKGLDQDIIGNLPKLKTGDCHLWSPAWLKESKVIRIAGKTTFDASATPTVGMRTTPRHLTPIDMENIRKAMATTIEKSKANDPTELKKQIVLLKAMVELQMDRPMVVKEVAKEKRVEIQILKDAQIKRLEAATASIGKASSRVIDLLTDLVSAIGKASAPTPKVSVTPLRIPAVVRNANQDWRQAIRVETKKEHPEASNNLGKGEKAILLVTAQYPEGATREQITVMTGYKRSSRDTYFQRLFQAGLIMTTGNGIRATQEGIAMLGKDFELLPTGEALRSYWLNRLGGGERAILEVVMNAYPKAVERDHISEITQYQRSSRDTYLQRLSARQLVVSESRGAVKASDTLFLE